MNSKKAKLPIYIAPNITYPQPIIQVSWCCNLLINPAMKNIDPTIKKGKGKIEARDKL